MITIPSFPSQLLGQSANYFKNEVSGMSRRLTRTIRMAIGQIPHGLIIQKIKPRIWLPSMVVVWAVLTVRPP